MMASSLLLKQVSRRLRSWSLLSSPTCCRLHSVQNSNKGLLSDSQTNLAQSKQYPLQSHVCPGHRMFCTQPDGKDTTVKKDELFDKPEDAEGPFRIVYSYPNLSMVKSITMLKLGSAGITAVCMPFILKLLLTNSSESLVMCAKAGILMAVSAYLIRMGKIASKIACRIYFDEEASQVKISHLNFWGRRRDVILDTSNMFAELSANKMNLALHSRDKEEMFTVYLNLCSGETREELRKIFGDFFQ